MSKRPQLHYFASLMAAVLFEFYYPADSLKLTFSSVSFCLLCFPKDSCFSIFVIHTQPAPQRLVFPTHWKISSANCSFDAFQHAANAALIATTPLWGFAPLIGFPLKRFLLLGVCKLCHWVFWYLFWGIGKSRCAAALLAWVCF